MGTRSDRIAAGDLLKIVLKVGKKPRHAQRVAVDAVLSGEWSSDERTVSFIGAQSSIEEVLVKWFRKWGVQPGQVAQAVTGGDFDPDTALILRHVEATVLEKS